jgi:hypothetical protein
MYSCQKTKLAAGSPDTPLCVVGGCEMLLTAIKKTSCAFDLLALLIVIENDHSLGPWP